MNILSQFRQGILYVDGWYANFKISFFISFLKH